MGSRIWQELATPVSIKELVELLVLRYAVDASTCQAAVHAWATDMLRLGFLDVERGGSA